VRISLIKFVLVLVGCFNLTSYISYAAEPNGILKIDGKNIKHLILNGKHRQVFEEPNEIIKLPVGTYYVSEIKLQGDYLSHPYVKSHTFIIQEGKKAVLKLGAPLTQNVNVTRRGNSLLLNYKLQGIGGETYSPERRDSSPKCTIYKDNKEIGHCSFKYG
jgi:hypothetical protein